MMMFDDEDTIISAASCTTNAIVPPLKRSMTSLALKAVMLKRFIPIQTIKT